MKYFSILIIILFGFIGYYEYSKNNSKPKWIELNQDYKFERYLLKQEVKASSLNEIKKILKIKVVVEFKKRIYDVALKQIKFSYDWNKIQEDHKLKILQKLNSIFLKINIDDINLINEYYSEKQYYGLYELNKDDVDVLLQNIYEEINMYYIGIL